MKPHKRKPKPVAATRKVPSAKSSSPGVGQAHVALLCELDANGVLDDYLERLMALHLSQ